MFFGSLIVWRNGGSELVNGKIKFFGGNGVIVRYDEQGNKKRIYVKLGMLVKRFYKKRQKVCPDCFLILYMRNYWYKKNRAPKVMFRYDKNDRPTVWMDEEGRRVPFDAIWGCEDHAYMGVGRLNLIRVPADYEKFLNKKFVYTGRGRNQYGSWCEMGDVTAVSHRW